MKQRTLPSVVLLGTGGTIAATAAASTTLSDYAVTEGIEALLAAVPEIAGIADIRGRQVFNVDSRRLTNSMLLRLAKTVNRELADPATNKVVITHGTDSLEETAYFLNLTVDSHKPVVMVGAMRPASAISADGPLNLYNAVLLAGRPEACGHGVLVAMNDKVHAARHVSKANTTQVEAFYTGAQGCLGQIANGVVHMHQTPLRTHTSSSMFRNTPVKILPAVDILYDHQSAGLHLYQAAIDAGVQGIVVAAMGNGSLSPQAEKGLRMAARQGIACVRASRTGTRLVTPAASDVRRGFITADNLNPQKARILLMLALTQTRERAALQGFFDSY